MGAMRRMRSLATVMAAVLALPCGSHAADMDRLLTGNMEAYGGEPIPLVDVTAVGKDPDHALAIVYGGRFSDVSAVSWSPGESVDVAIDLRAVRVIKTVHVRFTGDIADLSLSYSVDGGAWNPLEAMVSTYPGEITWFEAVDYVAPARYLRLLGTVGGASLSISNTRIYGADRLDQVDLVDGVYATPAPAVAGTQPELNVIIANTGSTPMEDLTVELNQVEPDPRSLGVQQGQILAPHRSVMFAVPWDPVQTEPHRIAIEVQWQGMAEPVETHVTIPVVNRRLWFGSTYRWATFEGPTHINLSTPYYEEDDPGQMRVLRRRGGHYLRGVTEAAHGTQDVGALTSGFIQAMDQSDGIGIDEYTDSDPEIIPINVEALTQARAARPNKTIAPWTTGPAHYLELFQTTADVILIEAYMTIYGPKAYEYRFKGNIDSLREYSVAGKAILVQGIFGGQGTDMTPEDLENSVRFVRHYGPELPGMGFYGGWIRGPYAEHYALSDEVCYRYFIAPVITPLGEPQMNAGSLEVTLRNVGGMNAHGVQVAAIEPDGNAEIARSDAISIPTRGIRTLVIPLPGGAPPPTPDIRILSSEDYTALQFKSAIELYAQHRAEAGGIGAQRVAYLSNDPEGMNPVPDDVWQSEDPTPEESRDDYESLNRHYPAGGAYHPSTVLDLGDPPEQFVTRLRCRGYIHMADEARRAAFLESLRVFVSDDNITYIPAAPGYEAKWGETPHFLVIDGLRTRARYIKINCPYEYEGKGYWVPKAPDDLDTYYTAGDGGLIGWDVYLVKVEPVTAMPMEDTSAFAFESQPGMGYGLETTSDLVAGTWTPAVWTVHGAGGTVYCFDPTPPSTTQKHYRIVAP